LKEEQFYYLRAKCFAYGVLIIFISLAFQPIYLFANKGLLGILFAILPLQYLFRGIFYVFRALSRKPAVRLTSSGLEIQDFFLHTHHFQWNELQFVEHRKSEPRHRRARNRGGGFSIGITFPIMTVETNFLIVRTNTDEEFKILLDVLQMDERNLEQMLRDFKREYYFN